MGVFKIVILLLISCAGFAAMAGKTRVEVPNNFVNAFEGTRNDMFGIASCIYNVRCGTRLQNSGLTSEPSIGRMELCRIQQLDVCRLRSEGSNSNDQNRRSARNVSCICKRQRPRADGQQRDHSPTLYFDSAGVFRSRSEGGHRGQYPDHCRVVFREHVRPLRRQSPQRFRWTLCRRQCFLRRLLAGTTQSGPWTGRFDPVLESIRLKSTIQGAFGWPHMARYRDIDYSACSSGR